MCRVHDMLSLAFDQILSIFLLSSTCRYLAGLLSAVKNLQRTDPTSLPLPERTPYVYKRLQSSKHIRVLELLHDEYPPNPIKCRLHETTIGDEKHPYVAISYAWGDPRLPKVPVECDGLPAYVPPTLYSAIQRMEVNGYRCRNIWADAICIDQAEGNEEEKSLQVQMMDEIFAGAQEVVVDLGLVEEGQLEILNGLDRYEAIPRQRWSECMNVPSVVQSLALLRQEDIPGFSPDFWPRYADFVQRAWFTRIWIVQEFALAKKTRIMIGDHFRDEMFFQQGLMRAAQHLNWLYLYKRHYPASGEWLAKLWEPLWKVMPIWDALRQIVTLRAESGDIFKFCNLLSVSSVLFKATDSRDKAYALLGMASDDNIKTDLKVDYNESQSDLMLRVSRYLIRQEFAVFSLYHCVGDTPGYASWAMNLTSIAQDFLSLLIVSSGNTAVPDLFNACVRKDLSVSFSSVRESGLVVRDCSFVDTIDRVMDHSLPSITSLNAENSPASQNPWLEEAYDWLHEMTQFLNLQGDAHHDFMEQGWRTLIADLVVPRDQEGQGLTRMHNWDASDRCIRAWGKIHQLHLRRKREAAHECDSTDAEADVPAAEDITLAYVYGESLRYAYGRRLGLSRGQRHLCLIPATAKPGDHIAIVPACRIPFVLRQYTDDKGEYFRIVGCAYVHKVMDGEIVMREELGVIDVEIS